LPKEITNKFCEVCGETAHWESRLSPMGFIKYDRSKGFSEWTNYYYCETHLDQSNDSLWNRLKQFKIG